MALASSEGPALAEGGEGWASRSSEAYWEAGGTRAKLTSSAICALSSSSAYVSSGSGTSSPTDASLASTPSLLLSGTQKSLICPRMLDTASQSPATARALASGSTMIPTVDSSLSMKLQLCSLSIAVLPCFSGFEPLSEKGSVLPLLLRT